MSYSVPSWVKQVTELLKQGKFLEAVWTVFASTIGGAIFLSILTLTVAASVYFRSGIIGVAGFMLLTGVAVAMLTPPPMQMIGSILILIGVAVLLYKLIRKSSA